MMIMPSNNTSGLVHWLAGVYPGSVGLLISPAGWRTPPHYMPYALDNGAFTGFDPIAFKTMLSRATFLRNKPIWVAVPDMVADAAATLALWHRWWKKIPFQRAFVAQDGHEPQDVPKEADAVFVGGTTQWKLNCAHKFKGVTPWLHIGRVNSISRIEWAVEIGADSIDGTGWFRKNRRKLDLLEFITGLGQQKIKLTQPDRSTNMFKPIETIYNGYRFRSRLEARWAVFFDALGLPYEYEKEGFDMDGVWYLPDFWIPAWDSYVEIKGEKPTEEEINKAKALHLGSNKKVLVIAGPPWPREYTVTSFGLGHPLDDRRPGQRMELKQCLYCQNIWVVLETPAISSIPLGHPESNPDCQACGEKQPWIHDRLLEAYHRARQARFENRESFDNPSLRWRSGNSTGENR